MKKIKNEAALFKEAMRVGLIYAEKRGVVKFETTDTASGKLQLLYHLLVRDKLIQPLAKDQETEPNMRHKLALWISRQLPPEHPLLRD